jgi:hypothetical protein
VSQALVDDSLCVGSDFIIAKDEIGEDLGELSGDIWRDEGIHRFEGLYVVVANSCTAPPTLRFRSVQYWVELASW